MTAPGASAGGAAADGRVPITSLGVQELSRLREQLQGDVDHLVESHGMLGRLAARSEAAAKAIGTLRDSKPGVCVCGKGGGGAAIISPLGVCCVRGGSWSNVGSNRCQSLPSVALTAPVAVPAARVRRAGCPPTDQPLLLPLTSSLYVKGRVASPDKLLVNVGTDYYVEVRVCRGGPFVCLRVHKGSCCVICPPSSRSVCVAPCVACLPVCLATTTPATTHR